ncbi:hemerythrin domain-containing protein [Actinocorallia longicatena]|uniref:Hemerythrin-like domain-containing protein n=1 Tax=Actinocorallia longicatena TaxID=111803 RepID=A0ABP6QGJ1_9ACTN
MEHRLDMTMMFATHDALRRELERIAKAAARTGDDPRRVLKTALGWELFKKYLHIHHTTEDDVLWPALERNLADRPDELALLAALEAEHAGIDPLLAAVDEALADRDHGHEGLAGLVDALATGLTAHLRHEENEGLALIDATLNEQEWESFGQVHGQRVGDHASTYLPWLLDDIDPYRTAVILNRMPAPLVRAYHTEWKATYGELTLYP